LAKIDLEIDNRPLALNDKIFGNWEILITFGRNLINNLILEVKNENQKAKKTVNKVCKFVKKPFSARGLIILIIILTKKYEKNTKKTFILKLSSTCANKIEVYSSKTYSTNTRPA